MQKKAKKIELNDEALMMIAHRFRILSDPMRLKILHTLSKQEMTVSELVRATNTSQANVSKHLSTLLNAGILSRRKDGLNAFYRVSDETVFELCELICSRLAKQLEASQSALLNFK